MESLLAKALESKLKYYLKSYTRDQFRLQGRTVELTKLELNGDVLHSIIGLPSTLRVSRAYVAKLEIRLPPLPRVNVEPTVVAILSLDLVLKEAEPHDDVAPAAMSSSLTAKSTSYGFADKIADGMTIEVGVLNLMLETKGGSSVSGHSTAQWIPPICSITIHNLQLYTTNEKWEVVNLADTRNFYATRKSIYIFRKLQWESLSVDLIPHPDMFNDDLTRPLTAGDEYKEQDGAKRVLFGGERFVDNISGNAFITMHRTEQNNPLGLEINLKLSEAISPSLSEPGLRALMRFMTGMYACLSRADIDPLDAFGPESAARSLITVTLERMFVRIKELEYQLELVLHSLHYVQASNTSDSGLISSMIRLYLGHLFLRNTFTQTPVTLVQPRSFQHSDDSEQLPSFASDLLWPPIHPLDTRQSTPPPSMFRLYMAATKPAPLPPSLASQVVIRCEPLQINLQEESCFRIASLVADGLMVTQEESTPPDETLSYVLFMLEGLDLSASIPSDAFSQSHAPSSSSTSAAAAPLAAGAEEGKEGVCDGEESVEEAQFTGAHLHLTGFSVLQDPFMRFEMLQVENDPLCYPLWPDQPVDASTRRLAIWADLLTVSLNVYSPLHPSSSLSPSSSPSPSSSNSASSKFQCIQMKDPRFEMAMISSDGKPLAKVPPPGGIFRLGIACQQLVSHTSRLQLLFVLRLNGYLARVTKALIRVGKGKNEVDPTKGLESVMDKVAKDISSIQTVKDLVSLAPGDSAILLSVDSLNFRLLESVPGAAVVEGPILAQLFGGGIFCRLSHRSLEGATALASAVEWRDVSVECVETEGGEGKKEAEDGGERKEEGASNEGVDGETASSKAEETAGQTSKGFESPPSHKQVATIASSAAAVESPPPHRGMSAADGNCPPMRVVFWSGEGEGTQASAATATAGNGLGHRSSGSSGSLLPFIDLNILHVIPYDWSDDSAHSLSISAKVGGVRLSGGWGYNEALLHRFGALGSDGGPGKEVLHFLDLVVQEARSIGLLGSLKPQSQQQLQSSKLKSAAQEERAESSRGEVNEDGEEEEEEEAWEVTVSIPRDLDIDIRLLDWLFALEGAERPLGVPAGSAMSSSSSSNMMTSARREDLCWHSTFRMFRIAASSGKESATSKESKPRPLGASPVRTVLIQVEGVQTFKPRIFELQTQQLPLPAVTSPSLSSSQSPPPPTHPTPLLPPPPACPSLSPAAAATVAISPPNLQTPAVPGWNPFGGEEEGEEEEKEEEKKKEEYEEDAAFEEAMAALRATSEKAADGWAQFGQQQEEEGKVEREKQAEQQQQLAGVSSKASAPATAGNVAQPLSKKGGLDVEFRLACVDGGESNEESDKEGQNKSVQENEGLEKGKEGSGAGSMGDTAVVDEKWVVRSIQMAVQEPVTVEATKQEVEHLVEVCRSEMAAASRIAVGALKLLQMRGSTLVTQAAIDQLINLGTKVMGLEASSLPMELSKLVEVEKLDESNVEASNDLARVDKENPHEDGVWVSSTKLEDLKKVILKTEDLCMKVLKGSSTKTSESVSVEDDVIFNNGNADGSHNGMEEPNALSHVDSLIELQTQIEFLKKALGLV